MLLVARSTLPENGSLAGSITAASDSTNGDSFTSLRAGLVAGADALLASGGISNDRLIWLTGDSVLRTMPASRSEIRPDPGVAARPREASLSLPPETASDAQAACRRAESALPTGWMAISVLVGGAPGRSVGTIRTTAPGE